MGDKHDDQPEPGAARPGSRRDGAELPGSHAIPVNERVDLSAPRQAAVDDPEFLPMGDPEGDWRQPNRWLRAAFGSDQRPAQDVLRKADAAEVLDHWFAAAEWCSMAMEPGVRAMGRRMEEAGEAILRGDKDAEGRAVPLGRLIGLQPPAGTTATARIALRRRDQLLRGARAAVPEWSKATDRQAASAIIQAFERYASGAWKTDQHRETRPPLSPASFWWQILRLDLNKPVPAVDRLADILSP